jgi:hypothetical protein
VDSTAATTIILGRTFQYEAQRVCLSSPTVDVLVLCGSLSHGVQKAAYYYRSEAASEFVLTPPYPVHFSQIIKAQLGAYPSISVGLL